MPSFPLKFSQNDASCPICSRLIGPEFIGKNLGQKKKMRYIKTRWFSSWPFWDGYISDLLKGTLSDLQLGYFWRFESPERVESVIQAILQNDRYLKKNRHSSFFIRISLGIITGS